MIRCSLKQTNKKVLKIPLLKNLHVSIKKDIFKLIEYIELTLQNTGLLKCKYYRFTLPQITI